MPPLTEAQLAVRSAILEGDAESDYERVPCLCGATGADRLLSEVDRHGLPSRHVLCAVCGLIRLSPRWREGRYLRFYQSEYRSLYNPSQLPKAEYAKQVAASPATRDRAAWVTATWARYSGSEAARIVELGAGGGWNLAGLPAAWERLGYDVDDDYLAVARDSFRLDMRRGLIAKALPEVGAADIVLLSHVVEHLADPSAALRTISSALHPGALLLIEVPGIFRIHRTNLDPRSYLQNAHTFTFCGSTLRDTCERAGLEVLELDETARATCRPSSGRARPESRRRPGLPDRIIAYLRLCDFGFRQYRRLRITRSVGRPLAYGWKRTYFASLGMIVPRGGVRLTITRP